MPLYKKTPLGLDLSKRLFLQFRYTVRNFLHSGVSSFEEALGNLRTKLSRDKFACPFNMLQIIP